jgi:hypothetical protein
MPRFIVARRALALTVGLLALAPLAQAQLVTQTQAGVVVDAKGVLRKQVFNDPTGRVMQERISAAMATLDPAIASKSSLRKVSLNRLEQALAAQFDKGRRATDDMLNLAGLTRIKYVFFYPDSGDIVVAGPAEGWFTDAVGRVRGIKSGLPVLALEDLIVALRAYHPNESGGTVIGCSIDPTQEGLTRMQEFLASLGGHATPDQTDAIVEGLRTSLGLQNVRIMGVSPKTHFAQVLVEADYRMKLIGIGLERPNIKLASYVDRASPASVGQNAMQRWFFTPDYHSVCISDDALAMELVGGGVKLVGEDEVVTGEGIRKKAAKADRAGAQFVSQFTKAYAQLAATEPVFAQLRNLIDMAIAAAYIQQQGFYEQANWQAEIFNDESRFPVELHNSPVQVETACTAVWRGSRLMTPIGGGVNVQAELALESSNYRTDDTGKVDAARKAVELNLTDGQWWWD